MSWEGCGRSTCPQEHPRARWLWWDTGGSACPSRLPLCVAACGSPWYSVGRSTSRTGPFPSTTSPTCWPCSTTTWLSGNLHQHLVALVTPTPILPGASVPTMLPRLPEPSLLSPSNSVSSLHPDSACREVPASLQAALDRIQKKATQLLLEELLLDLQVCWSSTLG